MPASEANWWADDSHKEDASQLQRSGVAGEFVAYPAALQISVRKTTLIVFYSYIECRQIQAQRSFFAWERYIIPADNVSSYDCAFPLNSGLYNSALSFLACKLQSLSKRPKPYRLYVKERTYQIY
jgi:hypothetical protein